MHWTVWRNFALHLLCDPTSRGEVDNDVRDVGESASCHFGLGNRSGAEERGAPGHWDITVGPRTKRQQGKVGRDKEGEGRLKDADEGWIS